MKSKIVILSILILFILSCSSQKKTNCIIKGKVIDKNCKSLILIKGNVDKRFMSVTIPIKEDNTFEYQLENPEPVRYSLAFEDDFNSGIFAFIYFVPDSKVIEFELYPSEQYIKNKIEGSQLTTELLVFEKRAREIFEPQFNDVRSELQSLYKIGQGMSSEAKILQQKMDSIMDEFMHWRLVQIEKKPTIAMYSLLVDMIIASRDVPHINKDELKRIVSVFNEKFPDHLYTEQSNRIIKAQSTIKVGGRYVDFSAPNSDGKEVRISDIIKTNKVTLIEFWAPWCGSHRETSRVLIPVYNKYKDYGFGVIGVVGGIDKIDSYKSAIEQEKNPWPNLMELKDRQKIWEKYNISGSGQIFLVNNEGIILAIEPTLEELEKILESLQ